MNRGHGGEKILATESLKTELLRILKEAVKSYRIPVYAYCLMDNHFHLVIRNANGQLSRFMNVFQTRFGFLYRRVMGGKGYVFQNRFHSTIVQDDSYLLQVVLYVLNNPVRAGIVREAADYRWSSVNEYFGNRCDWIEPSLVESVLAGKPALLSALRSGAREEIVERRSRYGAVLGDDQFVGIAEQRFDRRGGAADSRKCRNEDAHFEPVEKIFWEFARKAGRPLDEMDMNTRAGKRRRAELLVMLKDLGGLTYREIMEQDEFRGLSFSSLGWIYANAKKRVFRPGS